MVELTELIKHPERMNRDTLYELRSLLALHPYFQTARLLMLQNLYILHDPAFDQELRRAAIYITDRKVIFQLVELAHYQLHSAPSNGKETNHSSSTDDAPDNRTLTLIDTFLDSIPADEEQSEPHRRPTPADAAIDYVAYLLSTEDSRKEKSTEIPQMKGQDLIDTFLKEEQGRILLSELPQEDTQDEKPADNSAEDDTNDEEYFTETLARIYIKQGRYQKALDIIGRLSKQHPEKNVYFADQMRFLEKLIINNNKKQK